MRERIRGLPGQAAFTLVELVVAMSLLAVIGLFVTSTLVTSNTVLLKSSDQSAGLQDVRVASERVARDIREARAVECVIPSWIPSSAGLSTDTTCTYHLVLWIDSNDNYVQDTGEMVAWYLVPDGSGHYDLMRQTQNGSAIEEAHTIVRQVAFSYDYPPGTTVPTAGSQHTTLVTVAMTYDAMLSTGTTSKTVTFSVRVRNVS